MNQKKPTIYDVAKEAGVSPSSVSRVINHPSTVSEGLRTKIKDAMERLGFDSQTSWHKNYVKSGVILFVYPASSGILVENYINLFRTRASKDNRVIVLAALPANSRAAETSFEEACSAYRPIGIFALFCSAYSFLEKFNTSVPLIYVCDVPANTSHPSADYDIKSIMQKGIKHLKGRGCKNIVYLSQPATLACTASQLDGVIESLREEKLYTATNIITLNDASPDITKETVLNILTRRYMPDAVFCSNDYLAMHFMQIATNAGINIPADMLVLSIGGFDISKYTIPSLTTFYFDAENITFIAYKLLNDLLKDSTIPVQNITASDAELVLRESTSRMASIDEDAELPTSYGETLQHVFTSFFRRR